MKTCLKLTLFLVLSASITSLYSMSDPFMDPFFPEQEPQPGHQQPTLTIPLPPLPTREEVIMRQMSSASSQKRPLADNEDPASQESLNEAKKQKVFNTLLESGPQSKLRNFLLQKILAPLIRNIKEDGKSNKSRFQFVIESYLKPLLPYVDQNIIGNTDPAVIIKAFLNPASLQHQKNMRQQEVVFDARNPLVLKLLKIANSNDENQKDLLSKLMKIYQGTTSLKLTCYDKNKVPIHKKDIKFDDIQEIETYLPFDHELIITGFEYQQLVLFLHNYFPNLKQLTIDGTLSLDSMQELKQFAKSPFADKIETLYFEYNCEYIVEDGIENINECLCGVPHKEIVDIVLDSLSAFTNLKTLIIGGFGGDGDVALDDEFFDKLANHCIAKKLETLIVSNGELTTISTDCFNKFKKLKVLNLHGNDITGETLENLAMSNIAQNLEALNLDGGRNIIQNQFNTQNLNKFSALKKLFMYSSDTEDVGEEEISNAYFEALANSIVASNLEVFNMDGWAISPLCFTVDNLNKFIKLREFDVTSNQRLGSAGFLALLHSNLCLTLDLNKLVFNKTEDSHIYPSASFPADALAILQNQCTILPR